MPPNRGTDGAAERRRLRPVEQKDPVGRWLEAVFRGSAEMFVFSMPILAIVAIARAVEPKLAAFVALVVLPFSIGTLSHGRVAGGWPPITLALGLLRAVYYNAVVLGIVLGSVLYAPDLGVSVGWSSMDVIGVTVTAAGLSVVAACLFPLLARIVGWQP